MILRRMRAAGCAAMVLGCLSAAPLVRAGAPDADDARLQEIESKIRALQSSLEEIRKSHNSAPTTRPSAEITAVSPPSPSTKPELDPIARIRDEGLNHSQVMQTLSYLTDVIGPRLTGSPNLKRANEWTRDKFTSWGMVNAHLEPWGPFGRGWSMKRFSIQVVEPQAITLAAAPKAWSPGVDQTVTAPVIHIDPKSNEELQKFKGKLKGAIVLWGSTRQVQARFEGPATRVSDSNLLQLANADSRASSPPGQARAQTAAERRAAFAAGAGARLVNAGRGTTNPTSAPTTRQTTSPRTLEFLISEGALAAITPSTQGDGGTLFVASAVVPGPDTRPAPAATSQPSGQRPTGPRPWAADAPKTLPQVMMAAEDYNRLVRMIEQGEQLKIALELQTQFHDQDLMAYNTIAEIPGTDLKDQIVMLGAHMDSWHSGTGATDNGAGCAAVMEAVRILRACNLQPRRTIRIALWTGEEEGLLGSRAYVAKHFASSPDEPSQRQGGNRTRRPVTRPSTQASASSRLTYHDEFEKLSGYFNLDNGTGKIRGVYMQGNEAIRPIFRKWLAPFEDLGATTLTLSATGGTDHVSYDAVGLPGFQFIQDPIEYWSRTHHSNADVYDRAQADDLKQASTIIAAFVYNAAMMDERLPRKPERNTDGRP